MSTDMIVYEEPKLLSLKEVRVAGATANSLTGLRGCEVNGVLGGSLSITTRSGGTVAISLRKVDAEAIVGLLIERDVAVLAALNIETTE